MPHVLAEMARLLLISLALNVFLYAVQHLFGWSNDLRSIGGAALIVLGAFFAIGGSGGGYLAHQARARAVTGTDLKRYAKDRTRSFNSGLVLSIVGALTLGLAILFP